MVALNSILAGFQPTISPRPGQVQGGANQSLVDSPLVPEVSDRYTSGGQRSPHSNGSASPQRRGMAVYEGQQVAGGNAESDGEVTNDGKSSASSAGQSTGIGASAGMGAESLSMEEIAQVEQLQRRDSEVRAHEQAHLAAAGGLATSGMSFSYQKGPDGKSYAIGGEVHINTGKGRTPQETISKMARVRAAALAPADPSPQDRKVAAAAASQMSQARAELQLETRQGDESVVKDAAKSLAQGDNESSNTTAESANSSSGQANKSAYQGGQLARYGRMAQSAIALGQFSVTA